MIRRTVTLLLLVLLPFAGCSTVPETPRERLVAAELSYQAAVGTIRDMAVAGQIREEHAPRLRGAVIAARTALDSAHRSPDGADAMQAALYAVAALQVVLNQIAGERA
jgi:hypothetical protein